MLRRLVAFAGIVLLLVLAALLLWEVREHRMPRGTSSEFRVAS